MEEEKAAKEIIKELLKESEKGLSKEKVEKIKRNICRKYKVRILTNPEVLLYANKEEYNKVRKLLRIKPTRTTSGVTVVAVMSSPAKCPHGRCIYCPGGENSYFGDTPQSYTGFEPAARRAKRNEYDAFLQVMNRLEQYIAAGHYPQKIEVIVMGGTFNAREKSYKEAFIRDIYLAANVFGDLFYTEDGVDLNAYKEFFLMPGKLGDERRIKEIKKRLKQLKKEQNITLKEAKEKNEKAKIRIVGLTIETKPDYCKKHHIKEFLEFGATRIEVGVQTLYDDVLKFVNRGHGTKEIIEAFQLLKDSAYKINAHIMLGLPGMTRRKDIASLRKLFTDHRYRPDMLKIYPTLLVKGTGLYKLYELGKYKPISIEDAVDIISEAYRFIPRYVRVMRIQRDIPTNLILGGVNITNLRELVMKKIKEKGIIPKEIRSRQIGLVPAGKELIFKKTRYKSSWGTDYFIEAVDENDSIYGFIRLRFPYKPFIKEIDKKTALIRELHVYGEEAPIKKEGSIQHKGIGSKLLKIAENIAKDKGMEKVIIISGIGVREYYYKKGYKKMGPYVGKYL